MAEVIQKTIGMEEAEEGRQKPDTFRHCAYCDKYVLRSNWQTHALHDLEARDNVGIRTSEIDEKPEYEEEEEEEEEPVEVGGEYRVDLSYTTTHSFTVVAGSESLAEEKAKEMVEWGTAHDAHHMHTDTRKRETLYEDDEEAEEHNLVPY